LTPKRRGGIGGRMSWGQSAGWPQNSGSRTLNFGSRLTKALSEMWGL
jgi:hypothetical protein